MPRPRRPDHALVIGGSIAGLLSARVLSDHFARVTVIERDRLPDGPRSRRGVPQDTHLHGLMAAGLMTIERLLPGFEQGLADGGATVGDAARDVVHVLPAGAAPRFVSGLRFRGATRRLMESVIRRRVLALDRVTVMQSARVTGLVSDGADAIGGVRVRASHSDLEIDADLVVDASGRHTRAPDWLDALGFGRPPALTVDSGIAYASRRFLRPVAEPDWKVLLIAGDPDAYPRYGGILSEEDDQWAVVLAGVGKDAPPVDDAGFRSYATGLRSRMLHDAIADAEPAGPVRLYRDTGNRMYRYERMRYRPTNFIPIGDATVALNPVFGQGMTLAALAAAELGASLAAIGCGAKLARHLQRRLTAINRLPWLVATSQDFRHGSTVPRATRLIRAYTDRFVQRVPGSRAAAGAFIRGLHLVDPTGFLAPGIVARTLLPAPGVRRLRS